MTTPPEHRPPLEITQQEHRERRARLSALLQARGLDAICVFGPARVAYLSGFHFAATERPIALVITAQAGSAALLPRLEELHFSSSRPRLPIWNCTPSIPAAARVGIR
ncbi:aminopeptidase P family N-terminal domain-containing protein (plasmid) [Deinococcus sp. KNUC1210]|uniref:aminopeptidase P family N-terminal domain-containing protein n=1 Tax=Deinococcus sp. KNUC1210 TaxID=2917691 RepID=UPI001EEF9B41|nr:aminopeptidase P family N-terminal domain-containing protein [Deinococcus sp. KNUC1210]ULH17538.1 aminopeptidase P family N-terminal domain-containing protein [Deinococcus sp. KNUC1210]